MTIVIQNAETLNPDAVAKAVRDALMGAPYIESDQFGLSYNAAGDPDESDAAPIVIEVFYGDAEADIARVRQERP